MTNSLHTHPARRLHRVKICIVLWAIVALTATGCSDDKASAAQDAPILSMPVQQAAVQVNGESVDASVVTAYARERGLDLNDPAQKASATRKIAEYVALAQAAKTSGYMAKPEFALAYLKQVAAGYVQAQVESVQITDADLKAEFDAQVALVAGREFTVSLLSFNVLERAQQAERELMGGRPFAKLMSQYANTEGVVKADTLMWTNMTQFPGALQDALKALKAGEFTSKAIAVDGLWHFLSIDEERPFVPPNFDTVKEGVRKTLRDKRAQQHIVDVLKNAKIQ